MKPFINTYFNENDELVLVYQSEVVVGMQTEPQWIVIKNHDHLKEMIEHLTETCKGGLFGSDD